MSPLIPFFSLFGPFFLSLEAIFEVKLPLVGSLNLCRKRPGKMLKESYQYLCFVQRKHSNCHKNHKMVRFNHIFDIFSLWCNRIVLIHFVSYQTAPGTSLEYPQPIFLREKNYNPLGIFQNWGFRVILWDCGCIYFLRDLKINTSHV